jgi:hypothetical protein
MLKAARLLKTLAKPLWSAGKAVARNVGEFARDIRPGMTTPRLDRFASNMGNRVADAEAHAAGMGRLGRFGTRTGQFIAGTAPVVVGASMLPAATMPIWNTLQNVGSAVGQTAHWALDKDRTEEQLRSGGRDAMVNLYSSMEAMPYADRRILLDAAHQGGVVGMRNGAYAQQNGNPWGFRQGRDQLLPSGTGDMRGYLTQRALAMRAQQPGYVKTSSENQPMVKTARGRAMLGMLRSGWQALRGGAKAPIARVAQTPSMRVAQGRVIPPSTPQPASLSRPNAPTLSPPNYASVARKWLGRGTKAVAVSAPLPLAFGGINGWMGSDQVARDVGSDIAMNEFQSRMQQQGWLGRQALGVDPSLMLTPELYQAMPDFQEAYETQTGQPLQYGALSSVRNAWNNPSFLASDGAGSYKVPANLPFNRT